MRLRKLCLIKKKQPAYPRSALRVRTSPVIANLFKINLLNAEELQVISEVQNKIANISGIDQYSVDIFEKLSEIAQKRNVKVLSSDFEGILRLPGFQRFLEEAASISESKVIQGRFVAERITQQKIKIPQEFEDVINSVAKLARVI